MKISVDYREVAREILQLLGKDYPEAVASALQGVAQKVQVEEIFRTRSEFKMKTDWTIKNIKFYPSTGGQKAKLIRDLRTKHDGFVSVFTDPRISYMIPHETGGTQKIQGGSFSVPGSEYAGKSTIETSTGAVKRQYKARTLLQAYNSNKTATAKTGQPGQRKAFIMQRGGNLLVVRRKGKGRKPLQFLWTLKQSIQTKPRWKFESTGYDSAEMFYTEIFRKTLNQHLRQMQRGSI